FRCQTLRGRSYTANGLRRRKITLFPRGLSNTSASRSHRGNEVDYQPPRRPPLPSSVAPATELLGTNTLSSPVCKIAQDPSPCPSPHPMGRGWPSGRVRGIRASHHLVVVSRCACHLPPRQ